MNLRFFILFFLALSLVGCGSGKESIHSPLPVASSSASQDASDDSIGLIGDVIPDFSAEPIAYRLPSGFHLQVRKDVRPATAAIDDLIAASERGDKCGKPFTEGRAALLRQRFAGQDQRFYTIVDPRPSLAAGAVYYFLVLPNAMHYKTDAEIDADFGICAVGTLPILLHDAKTLVFGTPACGGAADDIRGNLCMLVEADVRQHLAIRDQ